MTETLILVNEYDEPVGSAEKMETHRMGWLHRAFSVFLVNEKGEMLLQQRAAEKYHTPNLWTNACCSHPRQHETVLEAAERRLLEEMGIRTRPQPAFSFVYKAEFDNGLTEHEYDHVFTGVYQGQITPDPREVQDYCYMKLEAVAEAIAHHPQRFTPWFRLAFPMVCSHLENAARPQPMPALASSHTL